MLLRSRSSRSSWTRGPTLRPRLRFVDLPRGERERGRTATPTDRRDRRDRLAG